MRYKYLTNDEGTTLYEICNLRKWYYSDGEERVVRLGSGTCLEDCEYCTNSNNEERWLDCVLITKYDRKRKLSKILK